MTACGGVVHWGDVSGVIRGLERKATALRARQAELDDALAQAGEVAPTADAELEMRDALA